MRFAFLSVWLEVLSFIFSGKIYRFGLKILVYIEEIPSFVGVLSSEGRRHKNNLCSTPQKLNRIGIKLPYRRRRGFIQHKLTVSNGIYGVIFLSPSLVWAAGEGGAFKWVFFQSFNFILFVVLLVFFVRKPLQSYYKARRDNFLEFENMARAREEEIQKEHGEWEEKLKEMEARDRTISERAAREGEKFRAQKAQELEELRERRQREARFFLRLESEKMKTEMLKKFRSDIASEAARELKSLGVNPAFHKKLQDNFLKNLEKRV